MLTVYPRSATHALGFDTLLKSLAELVFSEVGLATLEAEAPATDQKEQELLLGRAAEFQALLQFDDPFSLSGITDTAGALARVGPEGSHLEGEDLRRILGSLACARVARSFLESRKEKYPTLFALAEALVALPDIEKLIDKRIDERGEVRENATPRLRDLHRLRVRTENSLRRTLLAEYKSASENGYAADGQPTVRGGRMVLPIRAEAKRKVQGFVHDVSSTGQTVFIEPASCLDANNELVGIEADIRREVVAVLRDTTSLLVVERGAINRNTSILGRLDALSAKARLANRLKAVVPGTSEDGTIELVDARNPELVLAAGSESERVVVPLSLTINGDARTLIITGPNAGGKTVALKTVGLFALMLSRGIPVPADERTRFPYVARLLVDIGDEQSIENDLSTYSAHMVRLSEMVRQADARSVVLIDEAGTGTDPVEGGAIAQAVLELLGRSGAITIATTHHNSLKAFAHDNPGIVNGSMVFDLTTLSPTFRFRMGVPGSSYGLEIARRSGLPDDVLDRARELVGEDAGSVEELLGALETRLQGLHEQQERYERSAGEAEQSRSKYEERATNLREEKERILAAAQAEAARILKSANARVENTIREIREAQAEKEVTKRVRAQLDEVRTSLEKKVTDSAERKSRKSRNRPHDSGDATSSIAVGDQVVLDGGSAAVEVLAIDRKQAEVAFSSGRMRVDLSRLTKVAGKARQTVRVTRLQEQNSRGDMPAGLLQRRLDLRGARVDEALGQVTRLIDEAVAAGIDSVEILHGKGTGALRAAIRENLLARPDVRNAEDAPLEQGGAGITIVEL